MDFCLYTVNLHFAEIVFTDDETCSSLLLQDFNIAKEANGTSKEIIESFTVMVDGTLETHFCWAGKGTNPVPFWGVYAPLASAISVTPSKLVEACSSILSCVVCVPMLNKFLFLYAIVNLSYNKSQKIHFSLSLELQTGQFSLKHIKAATRNFDPANKIGEGGVYKLHLCISGVLPDGSEIAVKHLQNQRKPRICQLF
ncbi:unnamed protein product [Musa hybrid cultivar]